MAAPGKQNSGNPHGKTAKKGRELVQGARAVMLRALQIVVERGNNDTPAEIMADLYVNNPARFWETAPPLKTLVRRNKERRELEEKTIEGEKVDSIQDFKTWIDKN